MRTMGGLYSYTGHARDVAVAFNNISSFSFANRCVHRTVRLPAIDRVATIMNSTCRPRGPEMQSEQISCYSGLATRRVTRLFYTSS